MTVRMTSRIRLVLAPLCAALAFGVSPSAPLSAEEIVETPAAIEFEQAGVYVLVDDLAAAKRFYGELLAREPVFENPVFVGYYIEGGLVGVALRAQFSPEAEIGDRTVPYLRVKDIDAAFAHAQAVAPNGIETEEIIREGPIALFKVRDPEGNLIEFYSLSAAASNSFSE